MNFTYPGGTTVYIRESGGIKQFSTDQTTWNSITFPVNVTNSNSSLGLLKIEFTTDITITSLSEFFNCASSHLQFGSSSLKNDGSRPVITVSAANYDGFIANGDTSIVGNSNIYVYNLSIVGTGSLQVGAGWLGKKGFGNSRDNNYIINCSSSGGIISGTNSGGILGSYAGTGNGGLIYLLGCSSSGDVGLSCGGIVGGFAGSSNGKCYCIGCYTTGIIVGSGTGGIVGPSAGNAGGLVSITACYSMGNIGISAGGIVGSSSQNTTVTSSYSRGFINTNAGGIYGQSTSNSSYAINCYSSGSIIPGGDGIFGGGSSGTASNCYIAFSFWQDSSANNVLIGYPSTFNVGEIWVKRGTNQPYELNNFPVSYLNPDENSSLGYTPYLTANINTTATPYLLQSFNQTISASSSTNAAIVSGNSYEILDISQGGSISSYPSITINSTTGVISTTQGTAGGVYTIYVRSVQNTGYSVTTFNLTVTTSQNTSSTEWLLFFLLFRRYKRKKYPWLPIN